MQPHAAAMPGHPRPIPSRDARANGAVVQAALLDSRRRWRSFVALGSDWAFETDAAGRFTFVWPESALGWPGTSLLGRSAASLLAMDGYDPFAPGGPARGRTAWVHTRDGRAVLLRFCVDALEHGGVRGVASEVTSTGDDGADALRRADATGHVVAAMREEVLTSRMVDALLRQVAAACGADGATVVDRSGPVPRCRHATGPVPPDVLAAPPDGNGATLAVPVPDRLGVEAVLVLWRRGPRHGWSVDDAALGRSVARVIGTVLEQETVQDELARHARTDPLTALLNRRAFADELERRLARVQSGDGTGVLLAVDLDGFKAVNDRHGHEVGNGVLVAVAELLRHTFRPTDLLARLGGDGFAVWLDGADELTAAERADELCGTAVDLSAAVLPKGAEPVGLSVGVAVADPSDVGAEDLLRRAHGAMFTVKAAGGRGWHVDAGAEPAWLGSVRT